MKKINLFNRNTNSPRGCREQSPLSMGKGCPVERGGVWACWRNAPRITPSPFGATPSWKEGERSGRCGLWFAALVALFVATPSFAEPTELDKKTVASKAYVDTKQDMIPAGTYGANASVVTYDATTGGVQERWVLGEGLIAPAATMQGSFYHLLNQYNYSTGHLSSITANFTKIRTPEGTLRNTTIEELESSLVPLNMLAGALYYKQHKLPGKGNSTTSTSPLNLTPAGGKTIELETTSGANDIRFITAGKNEALTLKSGADNVILYINGTKTLAEYQTSNFGATGDQAITNEKYIKGALVSLELLKDVYDELNSKITNNALPTGTTGTVVTYNGTNQQTGVQQFTETAISGTATYDDNDQLTNGNNIANVSLVETEIATRQKKRTCAGYEPGHENEADYCWLWNFPD